MRATLSDPDRQAAFARDGYVTFPLLDADEVADLRAAFDRLGSAPGDPHMACHSSFHSNDRDYKVAVDAEVRRVLGPHLDRVLDRQRMLPCNYIVKWPGGRSGFGLHQDLSLVDERLHRSAEVWVALDDTDSTNGQLWMVPGSHTWMPTVRGIQAFPFPFVDVSERVVRRHATAVPVPAGHAVVFSHATLHFSMPNRSDRPRHVAITDVIPAEAEHLHFFGDGQGSVGAYAIDDDFWTEHNPFTLGRPPVGSTLVGMVGRERPSTLTDADLDQLVAEGRAIDTGERPTGAINPAQAWCHRCGTDEDLVADAPHRLVGNVTLLCRSCRSLEDELALAVAGPTG